MRWTVQPLAWTQGADMAICSDSDVVAIIQHDPDIQVAEEVDGDNVVWSPEDLKNAALLAAAPEMLAALEELKSRYTGLFEFYAKKTYLEGCDSSSDLELALHDTNAAIAKAKGGG